MEQLSDYKCLVRESERMRRELSKLKLKVEEKKKENSLLLMEIKDVINRSTSESRGTIDRGSDTARKIHHTFAASDPYMAQQKFITSGSCGDVTRSSPPGVTKFRCTSRSCQARADLEDCQTRLAEKCRENAHLCQLLADARSHHREFPQMNSWRAGAYRPRMFSTEGRAFVRDSTVSCYNSSRPQDLKAYLNY